MLLASLPPSRERSMVNRWQAEARTYTNRRENRLKILAAIRDGYDTLSEIKSHTQIPHSTCYKIIRRLCEEDSIVKTRAQVKSSNSAGSHFEFRFALNIR